MGLLFQKIKTNSKRSKFIKNIIFKKIQSWRIENLWVESDNIKMLQKIKRQNSRKSLGGEW